MPKKTTILILILAVITGVLIFLAVRNDKTQEIVVKPQLPTVKPTATPMPYATLSFSVANLDLSTVAINTQTVDILIDTNGKPVFGAQVELSYDPKVFYNVSIIKTPDSFFGPDAVVLINNVDLTQGRVSYAVALPSSGNEKAGKGVIATLSFSANKFAGVSNAQVTFLPKSTVTSLQTSGSILEKTTPLSVILTSTPTITKVPGY
jgi:hypothetical protein